MVNSPHHDAHHESEVSMKRYEVQCWDTTFNCFCVIPVDFDTLEEAKKYTLESAKADPYAISSHNLDRYSEAVNEWQIWKRTHVDDNHDIVSCEWALEQWYDEDMELCQKWVEIF